MAKGLGRYLFIGAGSNILNFAFYFIFFSVGMSLFLASTIGYLIGLFFSYHFGRTWVFDERFDIRMKNVISFALVYAIGGVGMSLIIEVMNKKVGLDFQISWIFGAVFAVVNNFLGLKFFVFNGIKNGK
ncbi:GtrA family protein [Polynucleobacter sp. MG-5-Ahmo-C2]|uniref:GtrA family protein n=1 Tax=Polynucleobacter sp. MG-5-Ahmo-C2 TaxID=2081051 RepID=UPI001BFD8066|nr:GtrA family protein [Polynucleobacter sp. MG-5-Ahmo-C2]QWD98819.1 GtrA family protein [Polynucleobacter sp. MG-5-Ahmo-C2]